MIDEADQASNHQVFLDFLGQMREYYMNREEMSAFHSVILAGVYDIKNLRMKIRPDTEHRYNSPWNVGADFDVDMSFSTENIHMNCQNYQKVIFQSYPHFQNYQKVIFQLSKGYFSDQIN